MDDEIKVDAEATETEENAETEVAETSEEGVEESVEDLKARLAKAEEVAKNQKIRAEKAEKLAKEVRKVEEKSVPEKGGDLSSKDTIAIINAKVHTDDIDEVVTLAKAYNVTVAEALNLDAVKATLALKTEKRNVAEATNVGPSRRGGGKVSDDALMSDIKKGNLPESESDIDRIVRIKAGYKQ